LVWIGTAVVLVVASTTVDAVVVTGTVVVVDVDVVLELVVEEDVVVATPLVTVKPVDAVWPFGLVALIVAPPGSEQLVLAAEVQAAGTWTEADPEPLATAIVLTRDPWRKSM
jgi:hypothetical protein